MSQEDAKLLIKEDEEGKKDAILVWLIVLAGYATGFWGVIGTLILKKNWRIAYFRFVDNAQEHIPVMFATKVEGLK